MLRDGERLEKTCHFRPERTIILAYSQRRIFMGLKNIINAVVKEGEHVVGAVENAADNATNKAKDVANEVTDKGRKAGDAVAGEINKARGIVSGDVSGFTKPSATYAERHLTEDEKNLARKVFKETLPYGSIYLSNGLGFGRRAYTIPHPLHIGSYVIHVGKDIFKDATDSSNLMFEQTGDAVFIHELTHVWQGVNRSFAFAYIFDSLYHQARDGSKAYDVDAADIGKKNWHDFNAEQQGQIVEGWYVAGMSERDPAFKYIRDNIRTRSP
jgi:hypothetical protein